MALGWSSGRVNGRRYRRARLMVLARDGHVCRMVPGCSTFAGTVDHVVPLALGGDPYDPANMRAACAFHNSQAGGALASRRELGVPSRDWLR